MKALAGVFVLLLALGCSEGDRLRTTTTEVPDLVPAPAPAPDPPPPPPPPPSPPVPDPPPPEAPPCVRPTANDAEVTARAAGTCTSAPCFGDYTQSLAESIQRNRWAFLGGCSPGQSTARQGTISCPGPETYGWRNTICASTAADDPDELCCLEARGSITFTVPTP